MTSPESIGGIVAKFDRLRQLSAEAGRRQRLNSLLQSCLAPPLSDHASLANIRDGCLVLRADSPAWASQIRFKAPEILALLSNSEEFRSIRSVRVRNEQPEQVNERKLPVPKMSQKAATEIKTQAGAIADSELKNALLKLAKRGK